MASIDSQRYLKRDKELIISTPKKDSLLYLCADKDIEKNVSLDIGVNIVPTYDGCHYETSELQIQNVAKYADKIFEPNQDRGLSIIRDLESLDSLLMDRIPQNANLTSLKSKLDRYNLTVTSADKSVSELFEQIDEIENIRMVSDFNPTKIDLTRPFHTSNWVAFIFWLLVILAIILGWSVIRHFGWYLKWVAPLSERIWTCCCWTVKKCTTKKIDSIVRDHSFEERISWDIFRQQRKTSLPSEPDQEETEFLNTEETEKSIPVPDIVTSPDSTDLPSGYWRAVKAAYGNWQLRLIIADMGKPPQITYYNPRTKIITDDRGKEVQGINPPSKDDIEDFYSKVRGSDPPPSRIAGNGMVRHKEFSFLYYNQNTGSWMNEDTLSSVPGLMPPKGYCLLPPLLPKPNIMKK